ncbi:MAG: glucose-6-phosphate isomerase, partial [Tannerellaceae bacterium]|nr:glucose-6-phosphate isomerase [Tannerellaceae bacterium]
MKQITLNIDKALGVVTKEQVYAQEVKADECLATLYNGTGAGNDFLGWLRLPASITEEEIADIENTANLLRSKCEIVVAIGIGGSYLGTKAVVEALNNSFDWLQKERKNPILLYAGQNIGEDYLYELSEILKGKQFGIINISKSGTTTEPALAFRLLKKQLEDAVGKEEARSRIVAITDASKGALRTLAGQEGYKTFVIPDNVGGRFSVLTPVGLLPIAVAGVNIRELIAGAVAMEKKTSEEVPFADNMASVYAAT